MDETGSASRMSDQQGVPEGSQQAPAPEANDGTSANASVKQPSDHATMQDDEAGALAGSSNEEDSKREDGDVRSPSKREEASSRAAKSSSASRRETSSERKPDEGSESRRSRHRHRSKRDKKDKKEKKSRRHKSRSRSRSRRCVPFVCPAFDDIFRRCSPWGQRRNVLLFFPRFAGIGPGIATVRCRVLAVHRARRCRRAEGSRAGAS